MIAGSLIRPGNFAWEWCKEVLITIDSAWAILNAGQCAPNTELGSFSCKHIFPMERRIHPLLNDTYGKTRKGMRLEGASSGLIGINGFTVFHSLENRSTRFVTEHKFESDVFSAEKRSQPLVPKPLIWRQLALSAWRSMEKGTTNSHGLGMFLCGSPETVACQLEQHRKTIGFSHLLTMQQFATLPAGLTRKNMALFAAQVMPQLRG